MSCNRLLYNDGMSAFPSNFSYLELLTLNTALSPLSCMRSSFLLSLALQKCQIRWEVRCGKIAALYSCSLASVGIKFFSLIRTPILWLAFLHTLLIWWLKFSWLSIITPKRFSFSVDSISLSWILMVEFVIPPLFCIAMVLEQSWMIIAHALGGRMSNRSTNDKCKDL